MRRNDEVGLFQLSLTDKESLVLIRIYLLTILLTPNLYANAIKVDLNLKPQGAWSNDETKLVQFAAEEAFRRMAKAEVANCAYRYASKEDKNKLRKSWGNQIPVINKSRNVKLTIVKKELRKNVLGQAMVGSASVDRNRYAIDNLTIDLSTDRIHNHLKTKEKIDDHDIWINVVAHEVAHTLGYRHGSGRSWSEDYPGYFVTEIGYCAMHNGEQGSSKKF